MQILRRPAPSNQITLSCQFDLTAEQRGLQVGTPLGARISVAKDRLVSPSAVTEYARLGKHEFHGVHTK